MNLSFAYIYAMNYERVSVRSLARIRIGSFTFIKMPCQFDATGGVKGFLKEVSTGSLQCNIYLYCRISLDRNIGHFSIHVQNITGHCIFSVVCFFNLIGV